MGSSWQKTSGYSEQIKIFANLTLKVILQQMLLGPHARALPSTRVQTCTESKLPTPLSNWPEFPVKDQCWMMSLRTVWERKGSQSGKKARLGEHSSFFSAIAGLCTTNWSPRVKPLTRSCAVIFGGVWRKENDMNRGVCQHKFILNTQTIFPPQLGHLPDLTPFYSSG